MRKSILRISNNNKKTTINKQCQTTTTTTKRIPYHARISTFHHPLRCCAFHRSLSSSSSSTSSIRRSSTLPDDGLTLSSFIQNSVDHEQQVPLPSSNQLQPILAAQMDDELSDNNISRLCSLQTYYIETYGCQMNVSDTEIVSSILQSAALLTQVSDISLADVVLLNTCAIRENAETKIWSRLNELRKIKISRKQLRKTDLTIRPFIVGVLGCMAERLKIKLLESDKMVDLVVGPDAYRDLPNLLNALTVSLNDSSSSSPNALINTQLSLDETYADITPVRTDSNGVNAYVSIMRGCENMCSYCIVPFTRGNERSRDIQSILDEVKLLSDNGFKEIMLLGQNVNSYNYIENDEKRKLSTTRNAQSRGFINISKRPINGIRFTELIDHVSLINPEMRIRFTSPHPKDFPDDLLYLIKERPNICNQIHIPAQSGSSIILDRMRRGYTRESYLELVSLMRKIIPNVSLSTDMIVGFCGETEDDHEQTLSLMREVCYDTAFMFAYSQREKTHAHRKHDDDVPQEIKKRRLQEIIHTFQSTARPNVQNAIGTVQLALVTGRSKRSEDDWAGCNDGNRRIVFPDCKLSRYGEPHDQYKQQIKVGDYVAVRIMSGTFMSYVGVPLGLTSLSEFHKFHPDLHQQHAMPLIMYDEHNATQNQRNHIHM